MTAGSLLLVFVTGLLSAPHCIAMCGGIVTAVSLQSTVSAHQTLLLYHAGRSFSYMLFGAVLGGIGSFLDVTGQWVGVKGAASIIGGLFILLWVWKRFRIPMLATASTKLHGAMHQVIESRKGGQHLYILANGIAFGFLPCGLTYAIGMQAAATGSWSQGALTMLVFALGTLPALAFATMLTVLASKRWRKPMRKLGNWIAILIGIISIMRGLSAAGLVPSVHHWLW